MTFSLSPMIIVPLVGLNDQAVRVKTLFDSGSGTDWIVEPLLKHLRHNLRGKTKVQVHAFAHSKVDTFQSVEVMIKFSDGHDMVLECLVIKNFMVHIVVKGIKSI